MDNCCCLRSGRSRLAWKKKDYFWFVLTIASFVILIIDVYCVWYPYLQTSSYQTSQCVPLIAYRSAPQVCISPPEGQPNQCPALQFNWTQTPSILYERTTVPFTTTASTLVPNSTYSTIQPSTGSPSNDTDTNATSNQSNVQSYESTTTPDTSDGQSSINESSVTSHMRTLPTFTPNGDEYRRCPWFPCDTLQVRFKTTYLDVVGAGRLYPDYNSMQTYPKVESIC